MFLLINKEPRKKNSETKAWTVPRVEKLQCFKEAQPKSRHVFLHIRSFHAHVCEPALSRLHCTEGGGGDASWVANCVWVVLRLRAPESLPPREERGTAFRLVNTEGDPAASSGTQESLPPL